ncbi:M1 family metallopeptidase [Candidatus Saccharibacteria bacterium]|nr:M1 family metallopeptidase [Candidatus Saccharibacteria bacterium]
MERLLDYFRPENYNLELRINKYTEEVQGHVVITGEKIGNALKLHSKNLKIINVFVNGERKNIEEKDDVLEILDVENGAVKIEIKYTFKLTHNMEGVYLSTYQYEKKEERIVSTQFESHYAREGFPCVDEPEAKATFDLKIIDTDDTDTILSNMPKKSERVLEYTSVDPDESPAGGVNLSKKVKRKVVEFETTPRMSTYLLAFVIGHFNKITSKNEHGVEVSTYAALNQSKSLLNFPNKIAKEALDFYDDLFGIPYPLPKMDQVAIPDFEAGAMENWGLVTYREACLLADENTPKSHQEYVATVITHELSHQWFGDLVTMKWWDNLWLNESFANMMQYYSVDKLYPNWKIWQDFFTDDCLAALSRDALPGVQSVQQEVKDPDEIATLFDSAIVYAKGARLIFMLMRLMGEKSFFAGLKEYFKKHKYGSTTGDDLWNALQPHAKFNVKEFMDAWIMQPGYPMLTDDDQQRFLLNGATDDTTWPLPKITDDMSGHYLINLSSDEFKKKIDNFDNLNLEQRLRLLIDRHLLSRTPIVSTGSLMELLPKFKDEKSEPIFGIVAGIMNNLKVFATPDTEYYPKLQRYIYNIVENNLKRLGVKTKKDEDANDIKMRDLILGFALYAEDEKTISELSKLWRDDYNEMDSEVRSEIIEAKFKSEDEKNFDQLVEDYKNQADPTIRSEILSVITDAKKPENVEKLLKLLEKPEIVRPGDHIYLYAYLLSNFWTREKAFDWGYSHWEYIKTLTSDKTMDDYVRVTAARVRTLDQADKFFEFFEPKKNEPALKRSIEVARVDIKARLRWIKDDMESVRKRLEIF